MLGLGHGAARRRRRHAAPPGDPRPTLPRMTRVTKPSTARESAGGKVVLLLLGGLLLLVAGAYAAAYFAAGDKVPRGTTVAGVEIGGQSPAAGRGGAARRAGRPGRPPDHGQRRRVTTARSTRRTPASRSTTPPRSREAGGEQSWAPGRLWDYWTGGDDLDAGRARRRAAFDAALDELADEVGTAADRRRGVVQGAARSSPPTRRRARASTRTPPGPRCSAPTSPRTTRSPSSRPSHGPARHRRGRRPGGARRRSPTRPCPAR